MQRLTEKRGNRLMLQAEEPGSLRSALGQGTTFAVRVAVPVRVPVIVPSDVLANTTSTPASADQA